MANNHAIVFRAYVALFDNMGLDKLSDHIWATSSTNFSGPALNDGYSDNFVGPESHPNMCASYESVGTSAVLKEDDCLPSFMTRGFICEKGKDQ